MSGWLISVAMAEEARLLTGRWRPDEPLAGRPCWRGELAGREALLQVSGMGMVNAAAAVGGALALRPDLEAVINLGCGGAFAEAGLRIGRVVLAEWLVLADLGVRTEHCLHGLAKTGIPQWTDEEGNEYFNRLPVDPALSEEIDRAAGPLARGGFATVGRVSGDAATARAVHERWGAVMEEMESAAVGLVALRANKPFAAMRGVSNVVGDRAFDLAAGAEAAQRALLALE